MGKHAAANRDKVGNRSTLDCCNTHAGCHFGFVRDKKLGLMISMNDTPDVFACALETSPLCASKNKAFRASLTFIILFASNEYLCKVLLLTVVLVLAMSSLPGPPAAEAEEVAAAIVPLAVTDLSLLNTLLSELASSREPGCMTPNKAEALAPEHMPSPLYMTLPKLCLILKWVALKPNLPAFSFLITRAGFLQLV